MKYLCFFCKSVLAFRSLEHLMCEICINKQYGLETSFWSHSYIMSFHDSEFKHINRQCIFFEDIYTWINYSYDGKVEIIDLSTLNPLIKLNLYIDIYDYTPQELKDRLLGWIALS